MDRPLKSIRKYCIGCCCNQKKEIELCPCFDNCFLYPFRFGKGKGQKLKAIRKNCLDCSGYVLKEVKFCKFEDCSLYPFRMGKNPNRKGIGGKIRMPPGAKNLNSNAFS